MTDKAKKTWADVSNWKRFVHMILFLIIARVTEIVLVVVVIIQVGFTFITGSRNERLLRSGGQLSSYLYRIFQYLTYNIEEKPYPFSDWPEYKVSKEATAAAAEGGEQGEEP